MLRTLEPTGSVQEDVRARQRAIEFAERLYRDLLTAIQVPDPDAASAPTPTNSELR